MSYIFEFVTIYNPIENNCWYWQFDRNTSSLSENGNRFISSYALSKAILHRAKTKISATVVISASVLSEIAGDIGDIFWSDTIIKQWHDILYALKFYQASIPEG